MNKRFLVFGEITIPIYIHVNDASSDKALEQAQNIVNTDIIDLIESDIYTTHNKCHTLIATYCEVKWIDAILDKKRVL